jgi:uncharacterized protein YndB with AHSA1/START domain
MARTTIDMEFLTKASPTVIYQFLTTPSCLVRWFCDAADFDDPHFTFVWQGDTQVAELIDDIEEERLRLRWTDADDAKEYFEYRISRSPITEETILEITDFCDKGEEKDAKRLWANQIDRLKKAMGVN